MNGSASQDPADALEGFKIRGPLATYHPAALVSLAQAVGLVTRAIVLTREAKVPRLLVVASGWSELPVPSVTDRYFFIQEWALAARGLIRLAVVAPAALIDPEKFGVAVARNRGLVADVFLSEPEALAWLQQPGPPD